MNNTKCQGSFSQILLVSLGLMMQQMELDYRKVCSHHGGTYDG